MSKEIVLFGSGNVAEKQLHLNPSFIVDNNSGLQGTCFHGVDIRHPDSLDGKSDNYIVIVCTTSISEVKKQLQSYGYQWNDSAFASELLSEFLQVSELEDEKFNFLISSGLPSTVDSLEGGGIYHIRETSSYPTITKIFEGNTHGLIKHEKGYAFTCHTTGIVLLDELFSIKSKIDIDSEISPHGFRRYEDIWVLVSSRKDAIYGVDDNGQEVFKYPLSTKLLTYGSPQHHCNDICIVGSSAFVSMFSVSGNYKRNCFDGGIVEIDLSTGSLTTIHTGLTMPHSIQCNEDGFTVLNSFKGTLLGRNFEVLATLPGFLRGYDYNETYYFMGESKNRNFSRLKADRCPVSIDSRITIMNRKLGFSRSVMLPKNVSEIHSLLAL